MKVAHACIKSWSEASGMADLIEQLQSKSAQRSSSSWQLNLRDKDIGQLPGGSELIERLDRKSPKANAEPCGVHVPPGGRGPLTWHVEHLFQHQACPGEQCQESTPLDPSARLGLGMLLPSALSTFGQSGRGMRPSRLQEA